MTSARKIEFIAKILQFPPFGCCVLSDCAVVSFGAKFNNCDSPRDKTCKGELSFANYRRVTLLRGSPYLHVNRPLIGIHETYCAPINRLACRCQFELNYILTKLLKTAGNMFYFRNQRSPYCKATHSGLCCGAVVNSMARNETVTCKQNKQKINNET